MDNRKGKPDTYTANAAGGKTIVHFTPHSLEECAMGLVALITNPDAFAPLSIDGAAEYYNQKYAQLTSHLPQCCTCREVFEESFEFYKSLADMHLQPISEAHKRIYSAITSGNYKIVKEFLAEQIPLHVKQ